MTTPGSDSRRPALFADSTRATLGVALGFVLLIGYFIAEQNFLATEYYAEDPPYPAIALATALGAGLVFAFLAKVEPGGAHHGAFAAFAALGVGLASYSFIPRLNLLTDSNGLQRCVYELDAQLVWQPVDPSFPRLHLYMESSDWWRQFKPGARYAFELRRGGLGIWQVRMSNVWEDQQRYHGCRGIIECAMK